MERNDPSIGYEGNYSHLIPNMSGQFFVPTFKGWKSFVFVNPLLRRIFGRVHRKQYHESFVIFSIATVASLTASNGNKMVGPGRWGKAFWWNVIIRE
jgi:hypothetical protein